MRPAVKQGFSPEEYLAFERASPERHEYVGGEVFAMTGASRRHNLIVVNVGSELRRQLKERPCETYVNDMRVKVTPTGLYTYPDVVVVCDEPHFEDADLDTLLNPTLLAEVLSESTEAYDRGEKFEHYRKLDSLGEYLLIAQDRPHVDQFARQGDGSWRLTEWNGREAKLNLPSIGATLALLEVYDKVES